MSFLRESRLTDLEERLSCATEPFDALAYDLFIKYERAGEWFCTWIVDFFAGDTRVWCEDCGYANRLPRIPLNWLRSKPDEGVAEVAAASLVWRRELLLLLFPPTVSTFLFASLRKFLKSENTSGDETEELLWLSGFNWFVRYRKELICRKKQENEEVRLERK